MNEKLFAAEALIKSLRTGEHSAAEALKRHLDQDVVLEANGPMPGASSATYSGR